MSNRVIFNQISIREFKFESIELKSLILFFEKFKRLYNPMENRLV